MSLSSVDSPTDVHSPTEGGTAKPADVGPEALELIRVRLSAAAGRMASAECWWLDLVSECDETLAWFGYGVRDCAHWISYSCSMSLGTAREHVRVARALRTLPLFRAEFAAGRLSYSKVREATRIADRVEEAALLNLAQTATASQFETSVRKFRKHDPDRVNQQKRRKARWFVDDDGMVVLTARFPAEEGAELIAALRSSAQQISTERAGAAAEAAAVEEVEEVAAVEEVEQVEESAAVTEAAPAEYPRDTELGNAFDSIPPPPEEKEKPDPSVSTADALLQMARGFLATGPEDLSGEDRHLVVVHVDARLLAEAVGVPPTTHPPEQATPATEDHPDQSDHPDPSDTSSVPAQKCCEVVGVGGIAPGTAARLACDATVVAMIRGHAGAVLGYGRKRRLASPQQRRALMVRDGGCRFPSCTRTTHLVAHHVKHWGAGGRTDLDNLVLLCQLHHMAVHEAGFAVAPAHDWTKATPRWRFTDPAGVTLSPDRWVLDDADSHGISTAFPLDRDLDEITRWTDRGSEAIRPRWAGEKVNIGEIVDVLLRNTLTTNVTDQPAAA